MTSLVSNNFAQIISVVSFPHQLIQEEQLSVAGESMCTSIHKPAQEKCVWVNWLVQPCLRAGLGGSVGCALRLETGGREFNPCRGRQHSFVEIDHEIFSTVILSLPLIQEGQLSVSGKRMCTMLVNCLEPAQNVWLGKLTALDMTPLGRKTSTQTNQHCLNSIDWAIKLKL